MNTIYNYWVKLFDLFAILFWELYMAIKLLIYQAFTGGVGCDRRKPVQQNGPGVV